MRQLDLKAVQACLADPDYPEADKRRLRELVGQRRELLEENPLQTFWPHRCKDCKRYASPDCRNHRTPQLDFLKAATRVVAAFAGNQFGKTTVLIVWVLIQHAPLDMLPRHLRGFKRTDPKRAAKGRLMCPSEDALVEYVIPALKKWCPRHLLRGGSWDKAWSKQNSILHFTEGCGELSVYTYKQDPAVGVGVQLDYVAYDEPPPEEWRRENLPRLWARNGCERYALTPVNMVGGGIGWLYRKIWKRRDEPGITVVKASVWENEHLSREAIEAGLAEYDTEERAAREHGDFVHMGGMVYDRGFEGVLVDPPAPKHVQGLEVIVGIDPGLRNAAFVWEGFDRDNVCLVFDEVLLQQRTPADYQLAIALVNAKWGLGGRDEREIAIGTLKGHLEQGLIDRDAFAARVELLKGPLGPRPLYVIDPSSVNRSPIDADASVEAELARLGIYCVHANNAVEGGCQQIRRRIQFGYWQVSRDCHGICGEAEEYRQEDRPDGEFKVVKENDHRLDAARYAAMHRPLRREDYEPAPRPRRMDEAWRPPMFGAVEEMPPTGAMT